MGGVWGGVGTNSGGAPEEKAPSYLSQKSMGGVGRCARGKAKAIHKEVRKRGDMNPTRVTRKKKVLWSCNFGCMRLRREKQRSKGADKKTVGTDKKKQLVHWPGKQLSPGK